jgi:hypothetical protein
LDLVLEKLCLTLKHPSLNPSSLSVFTLFLLSMDALNEQLVVSLPSHIALEGFLYGDGHLILGAHKVPTLRRVALTLMPVGLPTVAHVLIDHLVGQRLVKLTQNLKSSFLPVTLLALKEVVCLRFFHVLVGLTFSCRAGLFLLVC